MSFLLEKGTAPSGIEKRQFPDRPLPLQRRWLRGREFALALGTHAFQSFVHIDAAKAAKAAFQSVFVDCRGWPPVPNAPEYPLLPPAKSLSLPRGRSAAFPRLFRSHNGGRLRSPASMAGPVPPPSGTMPKGITRSRQQLLLRSVGVRYRIRRHPHLRKQKSGSDRKESGGSTPFGSAMCARCLRK